MIIFTLRRFLLLLVTLFFLTFIGFSLSYFTPHAPLQGASLWNAWVFWFNGLIHWDFGVSSINGQLISEQLKEVFPATMELCVLAFGFALMVGIPIGMLAGITRNKWPDRCISAFALMGFSIPVFWLALLLTLFFSLTLGGCPCLVVLICFMKSNPSPVLLSSTRGFPTRRGAMKCWSAQYATWCCRC